MKIANNHNKNKKILLIVSIVIIIATVCTGMYIFLTRNKKDEPIVKPVNTVNYNPPSKDEVKTGQNIKQNETEPTSPKGQDSEAPNQPATTVPVTITAANQNGAILQVRALVEKVSSQGTCTVKLVRGSTIGYTATASVQPLANSSACMGFDISLTNISKGAWTLQIDFSEDTIKGNVSQEVTIS